MSNTKQKIEELRQKLNELEQQWESERVAEEIKPPSSFKLGVEVTSDPYMADISWRACFYKPSNINLETLHEKMEKTFQLESWVLANIRAGEERDYEVYHDGNEWRVSGSTNMSSLGTRIMPERLANILCDKLNSGEWKL